jgi:hypothetical protein
VSQCASTQVGVDGPRVGLEKLSWHGWFDNLARPELLVGLGEEAFHDGLDGGVLHCVGNTGVPMCFAREETFLVRGPKKMVVSLAGYIIG